MYALFKAARTTLKQHFSNNLIYSDL